MPLKPSLRRRVALGIALFSILLVSAHSVVVYLLMEQQEEALIDQIVSEEMDYLVGQFQHDARVLPPHTDNLNGYIVRTAAERLTLPAHLQQLGPGVHEVQADEKELHVAVRNLGTSWFYLAYEVTHHEARLKEFGWLLLLSLTLTAVLSAWLGYALSGMLTRPVSDLAQRVDRLRAGNGRERLAQNYADEELQRLAHAFDGYLQRMNDLIQREREFTANVSHELRTPLTAIQTGCELLAQDPGLAPASRERLVRIDRARERLAQIVPALLFLARSDRPDELEEVGLGECLNEAVEPLREVFTRKAIAFESAVDPGVTLRVNRTALYITLSNLIKNALDHTETGRIHAVYRDHQLVIADTGRGISAQELPRIFERFYRGAGDTEGFGLGLSIVQRLCERYGWRLTLDSRPGEGTRVAVAFRPADTASHNLHEALTKSPPTPV